MQGCKIDQSHFISGDTVLRSVRNLTLGDKDKASPLSPGAAGGARSRGTGCAQDGTVSAQIDAERAVGAPGRLVGLVEQREGAAAAQGSPGGCTGGSESTCVPAQGGNIHPHASRCGGRGAHGPERGVPAGGQPAAPCLLNASPAGRAASALGRQQRDRDRDRAAVQLQGWQRDKETAAVPGIARGKPVAQPSARCSANASFAHYI